MEKVKVLVVDDSAFMRKLITGFLEEDERTEVVGTARNGKDALQKIRVLQPQVVTLDVEMPIMNGLDALQNIMKEVPTPCIMLSSTTKEGADNTLLAMQLGAFDFVPKPSGSISLDLDKIKHLFIEKVLAAHQADIKILCQQANRNSLLQSSLSIGNNFEHAEDCHIEKNWAMGKKKIVCIGTSTGGPGALQSVLTALPADFEVPILIVQHMPAGFTSSLARRLDTLSAIKVKEAENGELIVKGTAYIAPGGFHLRIKKAGMSLAVLLDKEKPRGGHRPSVDVMFESVAMQKDYSKIAVIMTGMGNDGTKGLISLKKTGYVKAVAESRETSVVFGMPKAAIASKCVDRVENVNNIAQAILKFCEN